MTRHARLGSGERPFPRLLRSLSDNNENQKYVRARYKRPHRNRRYLVLLERRQRRENAASDATSDPQKHLIFATEDERTREHIFFSVSIAALLAASRAPRILGAISSE